MHEITRSRYKDAKKAPEMPKIKQNTIEKSGTTFAERKDKYFPFHRKVEVPQQVEQSRQVEGERQSTICNSSWYDLAAQVRDNVSSMFSYVWEKKSALLLGGMLASARGLGADARLQRGGTALDPLGTAMQRLLLIGGNSTPPRTELLSLNLIQAVSHLVSLTISEKLERQRALFEKLRGKMQGGNSLSRRAVSQSAGSSIMRLHRSTPIRRRP